jgi:hypothetical protein
MIVNTLIFMTEKLLHKLVFMLRSPEITIDNLSFTAKFVKLSIQSLFLSHKNMIKAE